MTQPSGTAKHHLEYVSSIWCFWRQGHCLETKYASGSGNVPAPYQKSLSAKKTWFFGKWEKIPASLQFLRSSPRFEITPVLHWYSERETGTHCCWTSDLTSRDSFVTNLWWAIIRERNTLWWLMLLQIWGYYVWASWNIAASFYDVRWRHSNKLYVRGNIDLNSVQVCVWIYHQYHHLHLADRWEFEYENCFTIYISKWEERFSVIINFVAFTVNRKWLDLFFTEMKRREWKGMQLLGISWLERSIRVLIHFLAYHSCASSIQRSVQFGV